MWVCVLDTGSIPVSSTSYRVRQICSVFLNLTLFINAKKIRVLPMPDRKRLIPAMFLKDAVRNSRTDISNGEEIRRSCYMSRISSPSCSFWNENRLRASGTPPIVRISYITKAIELVITWATMAREGSRQTVGKSGFWRKWRNGQTRLARINIIQTDWGNSCRFNSCLSSQTGN